MDNKRNDLFYGNYPSLGGIRKNYGTPVLYTWLEARFVELCEDTNVKALLTESQINKLCTHIISTYYDYKLTELLCFFYDLSNGKYGRFYGAIDPQMIGESLEEFDKERQQKRIDFKEKQKKEADEKFRKERAEQERRGELMTREEYLEIAWLNNMENYGKTTTKEK